MKPKFSQLVVPILLALCVLSIYAFSSYKPRLNESENVDTTRKSNIPLLLNAEILSSSKASNTENITLKTGANPEEVMRFYDNVLSKDSWELESESQGDGYFTKKYKNDDDLMSVSATSQKTNQNEIYTIVTVTYEDN